MTSADVQVLVVGAGPAGCSAAITAAARGLDVLVVDKARFPRDKTCGDGLTTGALRQLERLGLALDALPSYEPVRDVMLLGPDGREISLHLPDGGQYAGVAPRAELDAALVALTGSHGVEVRQECKLESIVVDQSGAKVAFADGSSLHARHVIAADGHYSSVRRALDLSAPDLGTWHAFRQYFSDVDDRRLWVLFEEDLLPGYAWVFPLPSGRANVGYGVLRGPATTGKRLAKLWHDVVERDSVRAVLGDRAQPEGTLRAWPIPARLDPGALTHGCVLFVGDAAGVVDPLTGEGIGQALESGALAAEAIADGRNAWDIERVYQERVMAALGHDLRFAGLLQHLVARPWAMKAALRTIDANDWTRRNFARWMFEDYPRALLVTPERWKPGVFRGAPAYRSYTPRT